ncbi:MAG: hypothetical protein KC636_10120, partial [Myxococcales bacterium]|nr:hypothetical protein [Myxococcales bacterium]
MSQKTCQIALALALTAACGGGSSDATTAASTQGTGTTADSEGETTDACENSKDCETDGVCIAPFSLDPEPGPGGWRGPAICVAVEACIAAPYDLNFWCFDHDGCCGDMRCDDVDGICEPLLKPTTSDSDTDATDSSTTDSSTDATDSSTDATDSATDTDATATDTATDTDATDSATDTDT